MEKLTIYPTSDNSLMVQGLGKKIGIFQKILQKKMPKIVLDFICAYENLIIIYDSLAINYEELKAKIEELWGYGLEKKTNFEKKKAKIHKIPILYSEEVGWDLKEVAKTKKTSIEKIIELHSEAVYEVLVIGFSPGFAYMGGVAENLHCPRRKNARLRIPAGSLAIAHHQSAIYPSKGAGGWNIIGKTYFSTLDWKKTNPCLFQIGDFVNFVSISKADFLKAGGKIITEKECR